MYHPLANTELLTKFQWLYPSIFVLNTFLILFGFFIKNKPNTHMYYVLFLSVYYPFSLLGLPIGIGLLNILNGIIFMGIAFTALLLFPRFVVYFGLISYIIVYYLLAGLTVAGYLDYAIAYKPYTLMHKDVQNAQIIYSMFYTTLYAAFTITLFDISVERWRRYNSKIQKLSCTDELTSLLNRRGVNQIIDLQMQQAQITHRETSLIMVDIDNFKNINDQYGHHQGDLVLKHVANILRKNLRASDVIGRYGGEEFVILLPFTSIENAVLVAEVCRKALEQTAVEVKENEMLYIKACFGVSSTAFSGFDYTGLFEQADKALYEAKHNGKNQVRTAFTL
ncbi:GGDEF domain-containing protein [uncultured Acinetobacter sp.]|uniref:GGDEF domain-containing protein n=1 Tax=uncultured Acinetobacter sp. TaxID=165433 RepID=UPI002589D6EE|nr:GGDEF domain-containing protein [uncultured Acinetobacter sp.]